MMLSLLRIAVFSCLIFSVSCTAPRLLSPATSAQVTPVQPSADKEFRAAWVATVANINWPSKPGLSTADQQKEALTLLDFLQKHHFNAVILQVRPQADALYQSNLEPWSYFLTGEQGKAPHPFYDPLSFWTEAAHDRGLELHVWLNPYRAHHKDGKLSDQSIVRKNPSMVHFLKEGYWWMDPSLKETQDLTTSVVVDLVKRYDIDGIHMDDYFYPYPSYNLNEDFPDSISWNKYQNSGGKLSRGDWRRESVNVLIERLYDAIKKEKKHVKFGLSPFGIWRPGYPASIEGFDQHEKLYADARLWLNKGWIDYYTPQLYWKIGKAAQSFPVLLGWWAGENKHNRHLWPGISVGRDTGARTVDETINQIMITRGMLPQSAGAVHWSISSLTLNPAMAKGVLEGPYRKEALVPASPWLDAIAPVAPTVTLIKEGASLRINWSHPESSDVFRWVVYYQYGTAWNYKIVNRGDRTTALNIQGGTDKAPVMLHRIKVSAVDRMGNESSAEELAVTQ